MHTNSEPSSETLQRKPTRKNSIILFAFIASVLCGLGLWAINQPSEIIFTAAITLFVAVLWVTEALPIPATSLLPFALFPLFGVLSHSEAASALGSHVIILLMAAFMLSKGLERANLHKRFAIYMLRITGSGSPLKLVLGFMLTTAVLSMWISNTATILMMLPMAIAIINAVDNPRFGVALILGIAYSASLGGVGTPIGTPPNIIFMSVYEETQGIEYRWVPAIFMQTLPYSHDGILQPLFTSFAVVSGQPVYRSLHDERFQSRGDTGSRLAIRVLPHGSPYCI